MNYIKYIGLVVMIAGVMFACSDVPKVEKPNASFKMQRLDKDNNILEVLEGTEIARKMQDTMFVEEKLPGDGGIKITKVPVLIVKFEPTGNGYRKVLWTGEQNHIYDEYLLEQDVIEAGLKGTTMDTVAKITNTGIAINNKNGYTHIYTKPGTYHITCISTNIAEEDSPKMERDIKRVTLIVQE